MSARILLHPLSSLLLCTVRKKKKKTDYDGPEMPGYVRDIQSAIEAALFRGEELYGNFKLTFHPI